MAGLRRDSFKLVSSYGIAWLECLRFRRLPWLLHGFSTRLGGVSHPPTAGLNLGLTGGDRASNVRKNRKLFLDGLGANHFPLAMLRQVHSAQVYQVVRGRAGGREYRPSGFRNPQTVEERPPAGDALLTDEPGVLLSVRAADCLPLLLADPTHRAVAAVHAGWRGMLQRVIEKTVGEMRRLFGSKPETLLAAIGPSIRACCYDVGQEVFDAFCGRFAGGEKLFRITPREGDAKARLGVVPRFLQTCPPGHSPFPGRITRLDLVAAALEQLRSAGVRQANVDVADLCTSCRTDLFFSHRKEAGRTGRMMAVLGIRSGS